jgi:hypothetical protein
MEPFRHDELSTALQALRPAPRPAFAAKLDARVAAGFPRESRTGGVALAAAMNRLRALKPRQMLIPAGGLALSAIVVATVVVSFGGSSSSDDVQLGRGSDAFLSGESPKSAPKSGPSDYSRGSDNLLSETRLFESKAPTANSGAAAPSSSAESAAQADGVIDRTSGFAAGTSKRAVERSSELTLGTEPENVGKAAGEVFDVVHTYRGIVLRSQTSDGTAGAASAEFELLIPSAKLGDAMAAFSEIAEVRSRHEATTDITAPTVGVAEHLEDSRARVDSLLAQLAAAETESEREAVEAELRGERNRSAVLSSQLQSLERRANLSRVSLRIEGGETGAAPGAGGSWGIGDALHDAGRILDVAAAVTLVGLAVLGPIALIALLAWLAHRAWVRRGRRQALT